VLAVLYMLHIEGCISQRPQGLDSQGYFKEHIRAALERFDDWVKCACGEQCRVLWNFANEVGLSVGSTRKCRLAKFLDRDRDKSWNWSASSGEKYHDRTLKWWKKGQNRVPPPDLVFND
jgi:hypothetical protein